MAYNCHKWDEVPIRSLIAALLEHTVGLDDRNHVLNPVAKPFVYIVEVQLRPCDHGFELVD